MDLDDLSDPKDVRERGQELAATGTDHGEGGS